MIENHKPLPVKGYTAQPDAKVALVNEFKADEELLLRKIDKAFETCFEDAKAVLDATPGLSFTDRQVKYPPPFDEDFLRQAREHLVIGFMLLNRAVFQPQRIKLPEDEPTEYKMTAYGRRPDGALGEMTDEEYAAAVGAVLPPEDEPTLAEAAGRADLP